MSDDYKSINLLESDAKAVLPHIAELLKLCVSLFSDDESVEFEMKDFACVSKVGKFCQALYATVEDFRTELDHKN